ncbi:hypothetical protein CO151_03370 [bacterium CG_4_9_14_3_um_filter_65_15]|nr:MAG: hypothetical protein CO151_03370 [bacterium CG_4_9_14_3_um_filter_65_15]
MDTHGFWQEEIRSFPHGCHFCALWVMRREGFEATSPLRLLHHWSRGRSESGSDLDPPLGAVLKSLDQDREALSFPGPRAALWVEPIRPDGRAEGALALWFEADEPWREGVFLWGQRVAGRLGPVLGQWESAEHGSLLISDRTQLQLFETDSPRRTGTRVHARKGILLPRPLTIPGLPGAVGVSQEMQALGRTVVDLAASRANILLKGESGTGKEVVAAAIHAASPRSGAPFVGQNCAALPESLFESELFGHRAGAFTGARGDKQGLLASADKGTFFLDEIGDMPLALQIKLLRVMQERRVRRIGELQSHPVDIRFIAASHKDLTAEIAAGRFRLDLYYRLKVVCLEIPPLRQRPEDIPHLLAFFLRKQGRISGRMAVTETALTALQSWRWPGNVRELENEVQRILALYPGEDLIRLRHLSAEIRSPQSDDIRAEDLGILRNLQQAGAMLEQYLIRKALAVTGGRKARAARRLGLSRQGLYKKIARYGMADLIGESGSRGG